MINNHTLKILLSLSHFFLLIAYCDAKERTIALQSNSGMLGENEMAFHFKNTANKMNWKCDIVEAQDTSIDQKEYDFIVCSVPNAYHSKKHLTYMILWSPISLVFNKDGTLRDSLNSYDGYLLIFNLGKNENDPLNKKNYPQLNWYPPAPWINWYPTMGSTDYRQNNPEYLFYTCSSWSQRATNHRYKTLFRKLDSMHYTKFYGREHNRKSYPKSYISFIPADGKSLIQEVQNAGIILILHSEQHLKENIPSGRIFEGATASAVIISDRNQFVIDNFGDSVLYIDETKSGQSMFAQIDAHMEWIFSHKEEALAMAKKAHEIATEKFSLENQLLNLEKMHMNITKEVDF